MTETDTVVPMVRKKQETAAVDAVEFPLALMSPFAAFWWAGFWSRWWKIS